MTAGDEWISAPPPDTWTTDQAAAAQELAAGPRGSVEGPFAVLLHSPELLRRVQRVGEFLRFGSSVLEDRVRELAVLCIAEHWSQAFEWRHHVPLALEAGVPADVCRDVGEGIEPAGADEVLTIVWQALSELQTAHVIGRQTFDRATELLGAAALVELVTLAGYYTTLAMVMNTARTAPPAPAEIPDPHHREHGDPINEHGGAMNRPESSSGVVVARGNETGAESDYEATMPHAFGIGAHNGSMKLNVHTAYLEPGQRTRAHYHLYSDAAGYVLEGHMNLLTWDENYQRSEVAVGVGDYVYIPRGVIHQFVNPSKDTRFGLVGIYNDGIYDEDGTPLGKFYVEPPRT